MKRRNGRKFPGTFALYILFIFSIAMTASTGTTDQHPLEESQQFMLITSIAVAYDLSKTQTVLLLAIRDHEAGRPGKEFGVADNQPNHPARTWQDGRRSFCIQACYAAGLIKRWCPHVNPDALRKFNYGYTKPNGKCYFGYAEDPNWWQKIMSKLELYSIRYDFGKKADHDDEPGR